MIVQYTWLKIRKIRRKILLCEFEGSVVDTCEVGVNIWRERSVFSQNTFPALNREVKVKISLIILKFLKPTEKNSDKN